jgi:hypothetical protein
MRRLLLTAALTVWTFSAPATPAVADHCGPRECGEWSCSGDGRESRTCRRYSHISRGLCKPNATTEQRSAPRCINREKLNRVPVPRSVPGTGPVRGVPR